MDNIGSRRLEVKLKTLFYISVIIFTSCASGSAIVSGVKRTSSNPANVLIYFEQPKFEYEIVGLITSKATGAGSYQGNLNLAIEELKKQAASIGASGIIIIDPGSQSNTAVFVPMYGGGGFMATGKAGDANLMGKAIVKISPVP
jgi:hypothetical protein